MPAKMHLYDSSVLPVHTTSRRHFFFEESWVQRSRNVRHVFARVEKGGVVLQQDTPALRGHASNFGGSIVRLDDGRLRMYYTAYPFGFGNMHLAVAESQDGLTWDKPDLGQVTLDGHASNFLAAPAMDEGDRMFDGQPQVLRLPDGRWRMYHWKHFNKGYHYIISHSDDGLTWTPNDDPRYAFVDHWMGGLGAMSDGYDPDAHEPGAKLPPEQREAIRRLKAIRTNDASFVYYNDRIGRFEYYAQWFVPAVADRREDADNVGGFLRYIQRRFSPDGLTWSAPELIVRPDALDSWDQQFYHLAMQWHEDWMIGSLGHYRVENGQQSQDLELIFSRDGRHWHRPLRGGFIPRGADGEPDCEGVYPTQTWIDQGEHWLHLYSGTSVKHNRATEKAAPHPVSIMAARWSKHRFVGLGAGRDTAMLISEPIYPQQATITVDADVRGWLRAELCDVHGRKHANHHLMQGDVVTGDSTRHELRWSGRDTRGYQHDAVRVRLEFVDADVFSLGF